MLIHFAMHWPQALSNDLWPFAVDQAVYIWNHLPDSDTKLSPIELFTQTKFRNHHHLQNLHIFGCPVYVLDPTLQDAKRLPKWKRVSNTPTTFTWFSILKQERSLLNIILSSMTLFQQSIWMVHLMQMYGTP
jgi:hypothetical protein